ncbi:Hydroxypyruvate isomerase [Oleispira antarctica RB-8]|uniref:Hydroxypyruvate isomerase n=1 Tax=Oleispira antarctica RB-8 TaxID=698738 RepID=R4YUX9_OLEAN|nr:Hydroxypyruvate isomerase [Oleispira antarctica RB-8]
MKLAANLSMLFTEQPLLERFSAAKAAGFNAVEIQFPYVERIADIKTQLNIHDLKCVLINVPAGDLMEGGEGLASVPGKEAEFAAALVECLSYVTSLRIKRVNVLPGRCMDESKRELYLSTFKRNLDTAAQMFKPLGVTVTFEAINTFDMPGFLIHNVQQMLDVIEESDHDNIKMQFDIYHMARMEEGDVSAIISRLGNKIGHIQFADVPGRGEPGTGELDFKSIFYAIEYSSYEGWVGAEYKPTKYTEDTLRWKQFITSSIAMCS